MGRYYGCCYIIVYSAITALQNGACTKKCISKPMQYKTPFSHNGYMESLEIYENYITLFCLEKKNFSTIQGGSDKSGIFFFLLSNDTAPLKIIRFV